MFYIYFHDRLVKHRNKDKKKISSKACFIFKKEALFQIQFTLTYLKFGSVFMFHQKISEEIVLHQLFYT